MQDREVVVTQRDVEAKLVPSGTTIQIPEGTFVTLTQALGGSFSVAVNGNLARIDGKDSDAIGKEVPGASSRPQVTVPSTRTRSGKPFRPVTTRKFPLMLWTWG